MNRRGDTAEANPSELNIDSEEISRYRQILSRDPSSVVFAALAEAYRKQRLLEQAIATCKKGLRAHPDFVSGRVALARAYADADQIQRAQVELEKVVLAAPDNIVAQRLLADIYRKRQDFNLLERTLHRILALDARDEEARESLRWLETQQGDERRHGETTTPAKREIITKTLAEIYASQGFYEKAFEIYKRLSWQEPENAFFHERLADLKGKVVHRLARSRGKVRREAGGT